MAVGERSSAGGLFAPECRALSIGLVLIMTLVAIEALAVATAMPVVQRDLGGLRLYGLVFSAFMVANIVGITMGGRFADTEGPRRPFVVALALFAAGLTIAGLAPNMGVLVGARAVQGLGAGTISTTVYVVIGRKYDENLRPRMFALLASAWVVPGLVGPGFAAFVAETITWRLVFLGLLPLLPIVAAMTLPAMSHLGPTTTDDSAPMDPRLIARLALGAALCLAGFGSARLLLAVPLVAGGGLICAQPIRRLLPEGTFSARRGLPAAITAIAILTLGFGGSQTFVPLMLNEVRGQSPRAGRRCTECDDDHLGTWILDPGAQVRHDKSQHNRLYWNGLRIRGSLRRPVRRPFLAPARGGGRWMGDRRSWNGTRVSNPVTHHPQRSRSRQSRVGIGFTSAGKRPCRGRRGRRRWSNHLDRRVARVGYVRPASRSSSSDCWR